VSKFLYYFAHWCFPFRLWWKQTLSQQAGAQSAAKAHSVHKVGRSAKIINFLLDMSVVLWLVLAASILTIFGIYFSALADRILALIEYLEKPLGDEE
jgi:hypothetical protein